MTHQVDAVSGHAFVENSRPGVRLDLRKLELHVVGVHRMDLLPARRSQHLDDLH